MWALYMDEDIGLSSAPFPFHQFAKRVSMCRGVSHAAALLTLHRQLDLDLPQHSESLESHRSRLD